MLATINLRKSATVTFSFFALFVMNAPAAVKAQQYVPSAAPVTAAAPAYAPRYVVVQPARPAVLAAPVAAPAQTVASGDPYGFTGWLNSVRASYGLPAVGYDPNLSSWASQNNSQQQARGIGHFVMGPARRQNSAMGNYGSIGSMWLNSPAHRAALLDPTIRMIGIAGLGAYWTFNAY